MCVCVCCVRMCAYVHVRAYNVRVRVCVVRTYMSAVDARVLDLGVI